jgi:hypothetical protein
MGQVNGEANFFLNKKLTTARNFKYSVSYRRHYLSSYTIQQIPEFGTKATETKTRVTNSLAKGHNCYCGVASGPQA